MMLTSVSEVVVNVGDLKTMRHVLPLTRYHRYPVHALYLCLIEHCFTETYHF